MARLLFLQSFYTKKKKKKEKKNREENKDKNHNEIRQKKKRNVLTNRCASAHQAWRALANRETERDQTKCGTLKERRNSGACCKSRGCKSIEEVCRQTTKLTSENEKQ